MKILAKYCYQLQHEEFDIFTLINAKKCLKKVKRYIKIEKVIFIVALLLLIIGLLFMTVFLLYGEKTEIKRLTMVLLFLMYCLISPLIIKRIAELHFITKKK